MERRSDQHYHFAKLKKIMRMKLKNVVMAASLGVTVVVAGLTGCVNTQGRSYGQYFDDRMTAVHVKGALNDAPVFKFPGIKVNSFDHVVQLSGFVQTEDQRRGAGEIAR